MANSVEAKNIAKALFEVALSNSNLVGVLKELRVLSDVVKDASISALLHDNSRSFAEKTKALVDRTGPLSKEVLNILSLLVDKAKLVELDDISIEYQKLLDEYHGIEGAETVDITTAMPISDELKVDLGKRLADIIGKPVVIKATVDPSLIGGIVIRVGDKLIDGSLRYKLATLKKELVL